MIDAPDVDAARGKTLRLILQRGFQRLGRGVPLRLIVDFEQMAVRIVELIGGAVAEFAFPPADAQRPTFPAPPRAAPGACGLRARNAAWPRPEVFDAVSFSE